MFCELVFILFVFVTVASPRAFNRTQYSAAYWIQRGISEFSLELRLCPGLRLRLVL